MQKLIKPEDRVTAYAEEDGVHAVFICQWCNKYHTHGKDSGWRSPHCDSREYKEYYLDVVGPITPEVKKQIRKIDLDERIGFLIDWVESPVVYQFGDDSGKEVDWDFFRWNRQQHDC